MKIENPQFSDQFALTTDKSYSQKFIYSNLSHRFCKLIFTRVVEWNMYNIFYFIIKL